MVSYDSSHHRPNPMDDNFRSLLTNQVTALKESGQPVETAAAMVERSCAMANCEYDGIGINVIETIYGVTWDGGHWAEGQSAASKAIAIAAAEEAGEAQRVIEAPVVLYEDSNQPEAEGQQQEEEQEEEQEGQEEEQQQPEPEAVAPLTLPALPVPEMPQPSKKSKK